MCAAPAGGPFLTRRGVPVHQHLLVADPAAARAARRGDLELVVCAHCGFLWNRAFDPCAVEYGPSYDNTQTWSGTFREHADGLAAYLVNERSVRDQQVVEVGCGKGAFLRRLVEMPGGNNRGYGFDPSYVGPLEDLDGRLRFERRYYGPDCCAIRADAVVCRHVIEHVPDPLRLLGSIRAALADSPGCRLFLETPCVAWILRHRVVWDLFYEHCSYFTADSLAAALERAGFQVDAARHVFGGQYLWVEASVSDAPATPRADSNELPALAAEFASAESDLVESWRNETRRRAARESVALWGAGAKGVTFANLVDPCCEWLRCVADINPTKQGHYIPGTGHPIVGLPGLARLGVRSALVLNPNYVEENRRLLAASALEIELVDLMRAT